MRDSPFGTRDFCLDRIDHLTGVLLQPRLQCTRSGRWNAMNQSIIIFIHFPPMILQEKLGCFALGKKQDPAHLAIQAMDSIGSLHPSCAFLQIGIDHAEHGTYLFGRPPGRKDPRRLVDCQDAVILEKDPERRPFPGRFPLLILPDLHMPAGIYRIFGLPDYSSRHRHTFRHPDTTITDHFLQVCPGCFGECRLKDFQQGCRLLYVYSHEKAYSFISSSFLSKNLYSRKPKDELSRKPIQRWYLDHHLRWYIRQRRVIYAYT